MIRISCLLITVLCLPGISMAEEPASNLASLKRLFTTPYERAELDAMRRRNSFSTPDQTQDKKHPVLPPVTVEVKGVMLRQHGPNVVWVNDKSSMQGNKLDQDIRVSPKRVSSKTLKVPVKARGHSIKLKPGQVWTQGSRSIKDSYQTSTGAHQTSGIQKPANQVDTQNDAGINSGAQDN